MIAGIEMPLFPVVFKAEEMLPEAVTAVINH